MTAPRGPDTTPDDVTVEAADDGGATADRPSRRVLVAAGAGLATLVALTVPNAVVDIGFFTRSVPVRWWELPVALLAAGLVVAWFLVPTARPAARTDKRHIVGATFVTLFAVGCPTCNALMVLALGFSGALRWWGPVQPFLALVCVAFLGVAVVVRWRRRDCTAGTCTPGTVRS